MAAKTKKVILLIVDGPTDEIALGPILKKIYDKNDVLFHVIHGDMTSNWSVENINAVKTVHEHIEIERKRYGLQKKDIIEVIHLIDTDGAFIPAERVIYSSVKDIQYYKDRIESSDPASTISRNKRKAQVIYRLCSIHSVGTIPYYIYYFSRNLEHVLHDNDSNLSDSEKVCYADKFADKYISDHEGFISFLSSSDFAVPGDYNQTWDYIMNDLNSLHRYYNFHLHFKR